MKLDSVDWRPVGFHQNPSNSQNTLGLYWAEILTPIKLFLSYKSLSVGSSKKRNCFVAPNCFVTENGVDYAVWLFKKKKKIGRDEGEVFQAGKKYRCQGRSPIPCKCKSHFPQQTLQTPTVGRAPAAQLRSGFPCWIQPWNTTFWYFFFSPRL